MAKGGSSAGWAFACTATANITGLILASVWISTQWGNEFDAHALEHWVNGPCRVVGSEIVTWKLKKTKNQKKDSRWVYTGVLDVEILDVAIYPETGDVVEYDDTLISKGSEWPSYVAEMTGSEDCMHVQTDPEGKAIEFDRILCPAYEGRAMRFPHMAACHKDIKTGVHMGKYEDKQPTFYAWFKKKSGAERYIQRRPNGTITTCHWDPDHLNRISIKNVGAKLTTYYASIAIFCILGLECMMIFWCYGLINRHDTQDRDWEARHSHLEHHERPTRPPPGLARQASKSTKNFAHDVRTDVKHGFAKVKSSCAGRGARSFARRRDTPEASAEAAAPGENHSDLASSLNNVAMSLQAENKLAEAEPMYRRVLAIQENAFGENHPKVASSRGNLGILLDAKACQLEEDGASDPAALAQIYTEAADMLTFRYGAEDEDVLRCRQRAAELAIDNATAHAPCCNC